MKLDKLSVVVSRVIRDNPVTVADYKAKVKGSWNFLLGQVMKYTKGEADPREAYNMIGEKLKVEKEKDKIPYSKLKGLEVVWDSTDYNSLSNKSIRQAIKTELHYAKQEMKSFDEDMTILERDIRQYIKDSEKELNKIIRERMKVKGRKERLETLVKEYHV